MEKAEIYQKYLDYVSEFGKKPQNLYAFAKHLNLVEAEVTQHYGSFAAIEQAFWKNLHQQTVEEIEKQEIYSTYSVREKLLSYGFTWVESLKKHRTFVQISVKTRYEDIFNQAPWSSVKADFLAFVSLLINEGVQNEEIKDRLFFTDYYKNVIWQEIVALLHFWVRDNSENFARTDAFIEKSVNFAMDIFARNWLDSGFDALKHWFQKPKVS